MAYHSQIHHRQSIRLKGYDYSQAGLYFITICTQNRLCLFGDIDIENPVRATLVVAPVVAPTNDTTTGTPSPNKSGPMKLNDAGKMIETEWLNLKNRFPQIELHEFVIMPNHFHGILEIVGTHNVVAKNQTGTHNDLNEQNDNGQPEQGQPQGFAPTAKTVGDMIDAFKSISTVEYIRGVKTLGWQPFDGKLWQRNYWEHIIRNDDDYQRIKNYIINNPQNWVNDQLKK